MGLLELGIRWAMSTQLQKEIISHFPGRSAIKEVKPSSKKVSLIEKTWRVSCMQ